jgi:hypothetical protein
MSDNNDDELNGDIHEIKQLVNPFEKKEGDDGRDSIDTLELLKGN